MVELQNDRDRRDCKRIGGCVGVELESEGRLISCPLKDISMTGAKICIGAEEDLHSEEPVILWVEDWQPIEARIVWMTAHESGLQFVYAQAA